MVGKILAKLRWWFWGKWTHKRKLLASTKRMKQLAGIGLEAEDYYVRYCRPQRVGGIIDPNGSSAAAEVHRQSIGRIQAEPLPKPDVDDNGLN
jgi:hypothetical protein